MSKLLRLTSTRTPNILGETTRRLASVSSSGKTRTAGTRSNAGQKGICTVVVIASAGNSAQNVPSRWSNPSTVLVRVICCCMDSVSGNGDGEGDGGNFLAVNRRDVHSMATSNTRKRAINRTLASGGRQATPMTAQKQANQKHRRQTADSRRQKLGVRRKEEGARNRGAGGVSPPV